MKQFVFYVTYALRNIRRGGRWTSLAIFCIAAGVATVVALRSLGLAIGDSLVNNVRIDTKGDILLRKGSENTFFGGNFEGEDAPFWSEAEMQALDAYIAEQGGGRWTAFLQEGALQISPIDEGEAQTTFGRPQFVNTYLIDPATYPPTHTITTLDPPDTTLDVLLPAGERSVVVSANMAEQQGLSVGDTVRISGTEEIFTVTGIAATENEASVRNPFVGFFGFAYMNLETVQTVIDPTYRPNTFTVAFDTPFSEAEINNRMNRMTNIARGISGDFVRTDTAYDTLRRNETISQVLGDFIVVMGLGALLIGGVGILNTMLVMVRRRTEEIAALKTFGLKGRQIAMLFFTEGLMLGIVGSLLGGVMGSLMGALVNGYGETFLNQTLEWRVYPEAIVYGFALGLVTTAIFGVAPIMTALQVRPGIILRPNEAQAPRLGILQSIGLMVVVTIVLGLVVGQIVSPSFALANSFTSATPYVAGIIGVTGTLIFLGILVLMLWVLVWLVGKFPSFGNVDMRLALRNLSTQRLRTAVTLLALSAGMFALSSITFVGQGTRELLNLQLAQQFGGNVLVFPFAPSVTASVGEFAINNALQGVEGIEYSTKLNSYSGTLVAVNGEPIPEYTRFDPEEFRDNARNGQRPDPDDFDFDQASIAPAVWSGLSQWDSDNPNIYNTLDIAQGRNLTPDDRGKRVMVGPGAFAEPLGITIGSTLTYQLGSERFDFEVVGLTGGGAFSFSGNNVTIAPESLGNTTSFFTLYAYQIDADHVNEALVSLSTIRIPPTFAIDVSFIDSLLSSFIDQFAALPTVVGLLSLFAAAIIMANTVALSTLERRRQIGILKSVGLKSGRVLRIMLIETSIIGLLSAIIGLGLSALIVGGFTALSGTFIPLPTDARLTAVLLLIAAVAIGWLSTFLSANIAVRERVMNVLRYE
jgi:putative ABC transport system permease protein